MRFKAKKVYGSYKTVRCPFCDRQATSKNEQGIEVCHKHTKEVVEEIKCLCDGWLEPKSGKFGRYFNCINCGNMNYDKVMEIKQITMKNVKKVTEVKKDQVYSKPKNFEIDNSNEKKEITITSDDTFYFD